MVDFDEAVKHFAVSDLKMHSLAITALGHDNLLSVPKGRDKQQYFEALARAIVGQQLSTKAADTIWGRFMELCGPVTPKNVVKLEHEQMRKVGMSNAKARYMHGLAEDVLSKKVTLDDLDKLNDEAVIDRLIQFKGIGRWSAEMFLMFTLGRPDVFSAGDLGLIRAIEEHYEQAGIKPEDAAALAENWAPHRTTASLVLWHSRDNKPLV
jgi:DNA-3-methyladenine glycosylase II